jgi:hypothetical protein
MNANLTIYHAVYGPSLNMPAKESLGWVRVSYKARKFRAFIENNLVGIPIPIDRALFLVRTRGERNGYQGSGIYCSCWWLVSSKPPIGIVSTGRHMLIPIKPLTVCAGVRCFSSLFPLRYVQYQAVGRGRTVRRRIGGREKRVCVYGNEPLSHISPGFWTRVSFRIFF